MTKIFTALAVALTLATASVATTSQAQAGNEGAIIGGLVGGMILGGVIAQASQPHYNRGYATASYDEDVVVVRREPRCHKVMVEDEDGNSYFRRICR